MRENFLYFRDRNVIMRDYDAVGWDRSDFFVKMSSSAEVVYVGSNIDTGLHDAFSCYPWFDNGWLFIRLPCVGPNQEFAIHSACESIMAAFGVSHSKARREVRSAAHDFFNLVSRVPIIVIAHMTIIMKRAFWICVTSDRASQTTYQSLLAMLTKRQQDKQITPEDISEACYRYGKSDVRKEVYRQTKALIGDVRGTWRIRTLEAKVKEIVDKQCYRKV